MVARKKVAKTARAKFVRNGHGVSQDDARARLIDAAIELFAKKGYEGTSVRDLATAAGVNVAAVSYHFGSKDDLYHESLRACLTGCKTMRDLMQVHLEAAQRTKTRKAAEDALRGCVEDFLHVLISPEARHSHLVMREQSEAKPRFEPVIREFFQPVGTILREVILMLAPGLSEMQVFMVISGIIGQCLHVYKARISYRVLAGIDSHSPEFIEMISKHIAHLTALGLRGLEREKGAI